RVAGHGHGHSAGQVNHRYVHAEARACAHLLPGVAAHRGDGTVKQRNTYFAELLVHQSTSLNRTYSPKKSPYGSAHCCTGNHRGRPVQVHSMVYSRPWRALSMMALSFLGV